MSPKSLSLFAIITLALVFTAWYTTKQRSAQTEIAKTPLFPSLVEQVNTVTRIEIASKDGDTRLVKGDSGWTIENRNGFPAAFEKVKQLVLSIGELAILEAKTKNKERYARLGVEDIDAKSATSTLVTLKDHAGQVLGSLIIGKKRIPKGDSLVSSLYVRRAGEQQTFLVKGEVNAPASPPDWMDKELFHIDSKRIRSIEIRNPKDSGLSIVKEDPDATNLMLKNIPDGFKLRSQVSLNGLATALEHLSFEDVLSSKDVDLPEERTVTTFKTFDGLIATATSASMDDRTYTSFAFAYDPALAEIKSSSSEETDEDKPEDDGGSPVPPVSSAASDEAAASTRKETGASVEQEVRNLNGAVNDWLYRLPLFKTEMLSKTMDSLIATKSDKEVEK